MIVTTYCTAQSLILQLISSDELLVLLWVISVIEVTVGAGGGPINYSEYMKCSIREHGSVSLLGSTVVSPYVGMARKQNGGYNASISVQTLIFHLVVNSTRLKTCS